MESALVAPIVLLFSLAAVGFAMLVFRQALMYADARLAAERTAHAWDVSAMNPVTGAFSPYQRDGLYWRWFQDGDATIRWGGDDDAAPDITARSLSRRKLERQRLWFPAESAGTAAYDGGLFLRRAEVRLSSSLSLPAALSALPGGTLLTSGASATMSDPAETIRQTDLLRSYIPLIAHYVTGGKASEWLERFRSEPAPPVYAEEIQARRQLQQSVRGKEQTMELTVDGVKRSRLIDAIDRESVGHQALLGAQSLTKAMREQIAKDSALVASGKLQGAVWHFYRHAKTGKLGPSKSLLAALEQAGIEVVLHD